MDDVLSVIFFAEYDVAVARGFPLCTPSIRRNDSVEKFRSFTGFTVVFASYFVPS